MLGLKQTYWTHLVSKLVKDQGRVVEKVGSDVGVEPATLFLQGLGELPVIQRHLYTRLLYSLHNRKSWQVFITTSEMILVIKKNTNHQNPKYCSFNTETIGKDQ